MPPPPSTPSHVERRPLIRRVLSVTLKPCSAEGRRSPWAGQDAPLREAGHDRRRPLGENDPARVGYPHIPAGQVLIDEGHLLSLNDVAPPLKVRPRGLSRR